MCSTIQSISEKCPPYAWLISFNDTDLHMIPLLYAKIGKIVLVFDRAMLIIDYLT